ncbi:TBC1 domain family member 30-like [Tubulanus polymorphus]|uniref:TBC1 domain family member 30-like n=1 Tax=Tubulanus polymorphus TaxID=672921 RepID=UPI003DA4ADDE
MATRFSNTAVPIQREIMSRTDSEDELFFPYNEQEPKFHRTKRSESLDVSFQSSFKHLQRQSRLKSGDSISSIASAAATSLTATPGSLSGSSSRSQSQPDVYANLKQQHSIVDDLLFEIYNRWQYQQRDSFDSDTFTECSSTSDAFFGRHDSLQLSELDQRHSRRIHTAFLLNQNIPELKRMVSDLQLSICQANAKLVRQLKRRDRRRAKLYKNCDIITAVLQASSLKRRIDTRIKFSIEPIGGDDAFQQWKDAMKAVARLPLGIPNEFRKKVWLSLADNHIQSLQVDWEKTTRFAFNEKSNPDDNKLGRQIVKDLHRTGYSGFSGQDNEEDRAVLKRVLLAYARWNKQVGYCQGFNMLAALILEVMERKEDDALKVMIFLIDDVLPESYFANNLRALSVDMAVFRDLLRIQLPDLSRHLDDLQARARDHTGADYEPPLTNVFTMQWFLTLFATCLPKQTVLRVWDSVFLEGSEILLRTAIVIWDKLTQRIMSVESADNFYSTMGFLTQDMLDSRMFDADDIIKAVYSIAAFPMPQIRELREKYTYDITPFTAAMSEGARKASRSTTSIFSDDDDFDDEDLEAVTCLSGFFPPQPQQRSKGEPTTDGTTMVNDISNVSPGAYAANPHEHKSLSPAYMERMCTDINYLQKHYQKLRQRQRQAHVIIANAQARHAARNQAQAKPKLAAAIPPIESPVAVNHLFIPKKGMGNKNRKITEAPRIAPMFPHSSLITTQLHYRPPSAGKKKKHERKLSSSSFDSVSSNITRGSSVTSDGPCSTTSSDRRGSNASSTCTLDSQQTETEIRPADGECIEEEIKEGVSVDNEGAHFDVDGVGAANEGTEDVSVDVDGAGVDKSAKNPDIGDYSKTKSDETSCENAPDDSFGDNNDIAYSCGELSDSTIHSEHSDASENSVFKEKLFKEWKNHESKLSSDLVLFESRSNSVDCGSPTRDAADDGMSRPTLLELSRRKSYPDKGPLAMTSRYGNEDLSATGRDTDSHDSTAAYVTKLTYKSQKTAQLEKAPIASPSESPNKTFNPFPFRHLSESRAKNGIKLGLYRANAAQQSAVDETNGRQQRQSSVKQINRSHINACLHRQYMAEIRETGRKNSNR